MIIRLVGPDELAPIPIEGDRAIANLFEYAFETPVRA